MLSPPVFQLFSEMESSENIIKYSFQKKHLYVFNVIIVFI